MRAVVAVLLLWPALARAGDGELDWKVVETDHFVVHYYEPNGDLGHRVAVCAERAHREVTRALRHAPREKTYIVISDTTDGSNGFATASPRNMIHLFATAPTGQSILNDHDDWLYGLVLHEYTHIVHLDTTAGLPALWNRLWGKIWLPNQIQPRWFIEGLATYEESKRTSSGRTRNAIFDMTLRMGILRNEHLDLDQVSTGPLGWPHGNTAYLYGAHFLKYVADRYGDEKLADISHSYGRHPIPFNLGRAVRNAVGKNYEELYAEWEEQLRRRYTLQQAAVDARGWDPLESTCRHASLSIL